MQFNISKFFKKYAKKTNIKNSNGFNTTDVCAEYDKKIKRFLKYLENAELLDKKNIALKKIYYINIEFGDYSIIVPMSNN